MRKIKYRHVGEVLSIYDGDTIHAQIDLGFRVMFQIKIRLAGIDSAELSTEAGIEARNFLLKILPVGETIICESQRLDKYGRSLAIVTIPKQKISVNQQMIDANFAVEKLDL